jgi:hypothetical protein
VRFPIESFRRGNYKVAVSLKDLIQQTNSFSQIDKEGEARIKGCVPTLKESSPKEMYLHYNVKCSLRNSDPNGHDVKVRFDYENVEEGSRYDNVDVRVSCTCKAFLYWGAQWNLYKEDALEGQPRPLLQAPTDRLDLRSGFLICKHVKVVLDRIIPSVQRVINDISRRKQVERSEQEAKRLKNLPNNITLVDDDSDDVTTLINPDEKDSPLPYKPLFEVEKEQKQKAPVTPTKKDPTQPAPKHTPVVEPIEPEEELPEAPEEAPVKVPEEPIPKQEPRPIVEPEPEEPQEDEQRRRREEAARKRRNLYKKNNDGFPQVKNRKGIID